MKLTLSKIDIENVVRCQPDAIEKVLKVVKKKIEQFKEKRSSKALIRARSCLHLRSRARSKRPLSLDCNSASSALEYPVGSGYGDFD